MIAALREPSEQQSYQEESLHQCSQWSPFDVRSEGGVSNAVTVVWAEANLPVHSVGVFVVEVTWWHPS